jgi:hypothetical protein
LAETKDGKTRETIEIPGDGSSTEQERYVFRPQSTSSDGEGLRRLSIKPLCVIDDTQDWFFGGQLGQEAEQSEAHEQSVRRGAGNMAERHTKGISMRRWQLLKGGGARCAELLGRSKRELPLGLVPGGAEDLKPCGRIHPVTQEGRLANSGLPAHDDRAAVAGTRRVEDPIEYLALLASPE